MTSTPAAAARPAAARVVWEGVRPRSLLVGALPAVVGTAVAVDARAARPLVAAGCIAVAVLLQAGTNALNDAEDSLTGADDATTTGASLAMRAGWIDAGGARRIALACFVLAAAVGLAVVVVTGKPALLLLGGAGAAVGWAYTAPPLRLAYRALGELASALPMGLGITWGTAAAQLDHVPAAAWWAAAPLALLTAAVLHANNARDREHDAAVGKRTLATRVPPAAVVAEYRGLTGAVPAVVLAALLTRGLPWPCAIALAPGAMCLRAAARVSTRTGARGWTGALVAAVGLVLLTAAALALGLVVERFAG